MEIMVDKGNGERIRSSEEHFRFSLAKGVFFFELQQRSQSKRYRRFVLSFSFSEIGDDDDFSLTMFFNVIYARLFLLLSLVNDLTFFFSGHPKFYTSPPSNKSVPPLQ